MRRYELERKHVLATFIGVALIMVAGRAQARASAGSVSAITGAVAVERAGRSIPAAYGTAVEVGDKLTTGPKSRITISLADGSQLQLSESSSLVLTENTLNADGSRASTKVTLMDGLVRSLVRSSPSGAPNFEVHTPNAVASASGTLFDVAYHEGQAPPKTR
jgi:hypothetical protein